jgi:hypothetical protein
LALSCALGAALAACGTLLGTAPEPDAIGDAAAAEGSVEAGPGAPPFCVGARAAGPVAFCRDFDDGDPAAFGWTRTSVTVDAGFEVVAGDSVSPPAALAVRLDPGGPACGYVRGIVELPSFDPQVRVGFDVRVGDDASSANVRYFAVTLESSQDCTLIFTAGATASVNEQHSYDAGTYVNDHHVMTRYPERGVWTRLELAIDRAKGTLELDVDGSPAFATPQTLSSACRATAPRDVVVAAGVHCEQAQAQPIVVRYDNILVRRGP